MPRIAIITAFALAALAAPSGALAKSHDANHDGLSDSWEQRHHLSLSVDQSGRDQDHDGLNNAGELKRHTDPRKADSDRDGLKDGAEVKTGNNPRKRDTDGDGIRDGRENAGTIASFVNGILTIKLANGQTISGTVSDATHMSCEDEDENEIEHETTVGNHNQRRRGATASAARNGNAVDTSTGSASSTTVDQQQNEPGHHNGEAENEVENEHATPETEHGAETQHHNGASCSATGMTAGSSVHEAEIHDGSFSKVSLVS
jgi:hypothetical protein